MKSAPLRNGFLALIIAAGMIFSFYYLERAFRGGDVRRAVEAVQSAKPDPKGPTVLEGIQEKWGKQTPLQWNAYLKDRIRGIVLVTCTFPDKSQRMWKVDVLTGKLSEETHLSTPKGIGEN